MEGLRSEGEEDQVMSEVHLGCPPRCVAPLVSNFTFALPPTLNDNADDNQPPHEVALDKDGDLVLTRRNNKQRMCSVFNIQHSVTSSLHDVGLQVWKASLLLTDFILHKSFISSDLNEVVGVELGAGTGLVGVALARVARTVFITDRGSAILDNCQRNVHLNSSLLKANMASILVRDLNWEDSWPPCSSKSDSSVSKSLKYSWTSSDIEEAEKATLLLAADVIYSDDLTDFFFNAVENLMSRGCPKVLYLALEKRYNFSLNDFDVVANGYAHFRSFLRDEDGREIHGDPMRPFFIGKQIDISKIPKYIEEYERGKDLELWEIIYSSNRPK